MEHTEKSQMARERWSGKCSYDWKPWGGIRWGEERDEFAKSEKFRVRICHEIFLQALPCGVPCKHRSCSLVKLPGTFSQLANEQWNCIWFGLKENEQIKLLSPAYRWTKDEPNTLVTVIQMHPTVRVTSHLSLVSSTDTRHWRTYLLAFQLSCWDIYLLINIIEVF